MRYPLHLLTQHWDPWNTPVKTTAREFLSAPGTVLTNLNCNSRTGRGRPEEEPVDPPLMREETRSPATSKAGEIPPALATATGAGEDGGDNPHRPSKREALRPSTSECGSESGGIDSVREQFLLSSEDAAVSLGELPPLRLGYGEEEEWGT